jgi:hypothetical protein
MPENPLQNFDWNSYYKNKDEATKIVQDVTSEFNQQYENEKNTYALTSALKNAVPNGFEKSVNIQNYLSGNVMTGPNPARSLNMPADKRVSLFADKLRNGAAYQDEMAAFKPISFNGSMYGLNYNRYYHHPKFKELGFSPFRDNESLYNANSSWADDFSRMTGQWGTLWQDAIVGNFENWGDYSLAGDIKNAEKMEKAMSIANSSRGGTGAFFTNLVGNFAYTAGILTEILLEEVALMGVSFATGGGASGFAAAKTGQNVFRLGNEISKVLDYVKGVKSLKQTVHTLRDVSTARNFFAGAKAFGAGAGRAALDFFNPLEQTTDYIRGFNQLKHVDKLSDAAMLRKGFGAFYRDMRMINAAFDEAKLEGGFVQKDQFDKLMHEYYQQNGRIPDAESDAAKEIYQNAKTAGDKTTLANIPAILYSNKLVLDKALKGFNFTRLQTAGKIILKNNDWKKLGTDAYKAYERGLGLLTKRAFYKQAGLAGTGGLLRYGAANYIEGVQELYQEGVSVAIKDYYSSIYKNPQLAGNKEIMLKAFGAGVESQMSAQGLDVFLSGLLMGGLSQVTQKVVFEAPVSIYQKYGPDKILGVEIQNKEALKKEKEARDKALDNLIEAMNAVEMQKSGSTPQEIFSLIEQNALEQRNLALEMQTAAELGDAKRFHDGKDASLALHIHTLLANDKADIILDQLKSLRDLTDDELLQAIEAKPEQEDGANVRKRLENTITNAEKYISNWNYFNNKYGRYDFPKDNITGRAYDIARLHFTFNNYNIERIADRMETMLNEVVASPGGKKIKATDVSILFDLGFISNELGILSSEISAYSSKEATAEQKKQAKEKQAKYDRLSKMYNSIKSLSDIRARLESKDTRAAELSEKYKTDEEFRTKLSEQRETTSKEITQDIDQANLIIDELEVDLETETDPVKRKEIEDAIEANKSYISALEQRLTEQTQEYDKILSMTREEFLDYETEKDNELLNNSVANLKEAYFGYMKELAAKEDESLLDDNLEESLQKLIDFYALKQDQRSAVTAVNILSNPRNFAEHVERLSNILKDVAANRKTYLKEGYLEFKKILSTNKFFQKLFDNGMFLDPDSVADFRAGRMPKFLLIPADIDKGDYVEVNAASNDPAIIEKYNKALELIAEHEREIGRPLMQKTIIERRPAGEFDESFATKDASDTRTLAQLAATFGVDPKVSTAKSAKDVLAAILASPQATEGEALLARLLIPIVRPDTTVNFVTGLTQPGTTGVATGIQIDLRYGAAEFNNANTPMERVIIREVLKSILTTEYSKDSAFKEEIDRMFENANNWFALEENKEKYAALYQIKPLGLSTPEEFMTEAMTNPRFQALLALIKSTKPAYKSLFQELFDAFKQVLRELIRGDIDGSLVKEAVDIISSRIFAAPSPGGIVTKLDVTSVENLTNAIKNEEFDTLPNDLLAEMQAEAMANGASDYVEFYKSSPNIPPLLQRYALRTQKMEEPTPGEILSLTPAEKVELLKDLGYSEDQISKMPEEDQNTIIDNMIFEPSSEVATKRSVIMMDIKKRLLPLTSKPLQLKTITDADGKVKSVYVDEDDNEYGRVSDLKPEFKGTANKLKAATARGTHIDDLLREYLDPDSTITSLDQFYRKAMELLEQKRNSSNPETREDFSNLNTTPEFYKQLYVVLKDIRVTLKKKGFVLLTDVPTLYGEIKGKRAGTIDMLAVNSEGEVFIIDLKTTEEGVNRFNTPDKTKADEIQLNAYRELLKQRTGIEVKRILVLPLEATFDIKTRSYTSVKRSSNPDKADDKTIIIDSSRDIFQILGIPKPEVTEVTETPIVVEARLALEKSPEAYGLTAEQVTALTSDQILEIYNKGPVPVTPTTDIQDKKAEIETLKESIKLRQKRSLSKVVPQTKTDVKTGAKRITGYAMLYYPPSFDGVTNWNIVEKIEAKTEQEVINKINAKYDAELDALETKPVTGTQGTTEVAIKPEYIGKIIYATPGTGKTTLGRMFPGLIIDMDQVLADLIEEQTGDVLTDLERNNIGKAIYDRLATGALKNKTFYSEAFRKMKELKADNPDKIILTGTYAFIDTPTYKKALDVLFISSEDQDFMNHMAVRGNTPEEITSTLAKYRAAESVFVPTKKQKVIRIGGVASSNNLANVLTGQAEVTEAMQVSKADSQMILDFAKQVREAEGDIAKLTEIKDKVAEYIAERAKNMVTIDTKFLSELIETKMKQASGKNIKFDSETKDGISKDDSDFPNGPADPDDSDLPSDCGL